jgi:hypothetical protein
MSSVRIEFVRDYPPFRPGQVVDYQHPGAADVLVRRGIARPAVQSTPAPAAPPVPPKPAKKRK